MKLSSGGAQAAHGTPAEHGPCFTGCTGVGGSLGAARGAALGRGGICGTAVTPSGDRGGEGTGWQGCGPRERGRRVRGGAVPRGPQGVREGVGSGQADRGPPGERHGQGGAGLELLCGGESWGWSGLGREGSGETLLQPASAWRGLRESWGGTFYKGIE